MAGGVDPGIWPAKRQQRPTVVPVHYDPKAIPGASFFCEPSWCPHSGSTDPPRQAAR